MTITEARLEQLLSAAASGYAHPESDLSHNAKMALRADIERVRTFLEGGGFSPNGARAVALFCCSPMDLFDVVELGRPVRSEVVVGDSPFIEPLARVARRDGWCVVLVNRRSCRILRGTQDRLHEVAAFDDDVHGWHEQGGWSQNRYQRGIGKQVQDHVKRTATELFRLHRREPIARLIVGAPNELWPEVEDALHPYLRPLVAGRIDVDIERSTPSEVTRQAAPVMEAEDRRLERAALDRLADGLATGIRAVAGLDAVLDALNQQRVEMLLVAGGFRAPGVACSCGLVGTTGETCPVDGAELEPRDDIVETAVECAVMQSSDIRIVEYHDDLTPLGGIGAICRF